MKSKQSTIVSFIILALIMFACSGEISQPSEAVSNSSPMSTIIIPSPMSITATPTSQRQATATWYLKTATAMQPTPPPGDTGYYEGIIIITQYYTFLGHGLYEEAY